MFTVINRLGMGSLFLNQDKQVSKARTWLENAHNKHFFPHSSIFRCQTGPKSSYQSLLLDDMFRWVTFLPSIKFSCIVSLLLNVVRNDNSNKLIKMGKTVYQRDASFCSVCGESPHSGKINESVNHWDSFKNSSICQPLS